MQCPSLFKISMTLRDPIILCRPIAKAKLLSVNNLPRVTEKLILTVNDSITVSVLGETLFLLFFKLDKKEF